MTNIVNISSQPVADAEAIKLVIWDLDETFWSGTLTEGGITPIPANIELIRTLAARGIVSSVCSKNDMAPTRKVLEELGVWDYLVFPCIEFAPKGVQIRNIIESMQLRAPSVLFVDDNLMNLHEAQHYVPGIQVATPDVLADLASDPRVKGKPDPQFERLNRYKVLELKQKEREKAPDNTEFLRTSDIRVSFHYDVLDQFPRIHDLVNRTNQLNFTKQRWPEDADTAKSQAVAEYENVFGSHWGYVKVADRYGQYGICGFFELRNGCAHHFLFSCRAMNMGVEQFVWHKLKCPHVHVSGRVSSTLDGAVPDWIGVVDDVDESDKPETQGDTRKPIICIRGACDLSTGAHYLRAQYDLIEEYPYPRDGWDIYPTTREIVLADEMRHPAVAELIARTPGLPEARFKSAIHNGEADIYVLSFTMEMMATQKRSKTTGTVVPLHLCGIGGDDYASLSYEDMVAKNGGNTPITVDEWRFLQEEYEQVPLLDEDLLRQDVEKLFARLAGKTVIMLKLNEQVGTNEWFLEMFKRINAITCPIAEKHGAHIIDLAEFIRTMEDLASPTEGGVHFSRIVYRDIAKRISDIVSDSLAAKMPAS